MIGPPKLLGRFKDQLTALPIFEREWRSEVVLEYSSKSGDTVTGIDKDGQRRVVGIFVEDIQCSSM